MEDGWHTPDLAPDTGTNGGAKIGRLLEQTRKHKGLSLEEAEQATKIRKRYLAGLEREDYGVLPDAVYAQGFLKTYANFLGLDGEDLCKQLKDRRKPRPERGIDHDASPDNGGDFEEPMVAPRGLQGTEKRSFPTSTIVTMLVAVLVLAAVVGALYFVGRGVQATRDQGSKPAPASKELPRVEPPRQDQQQVADKEKAPVPERKEENAQAASGKQGIDGENKPVPPGSLQVVVSVQDRPSWLLIQADGETAYERVARPGFSRTFDAGRQLYLKCGDAGAVNVEINGQDLGTLGPTGTIVERSYVLKGAS